MTIKLDNLINGMDVLKNFGKVIAVSEKEMIKNTMRDIFNNRFDFLLFKIF